jgi:hypothetical protein
VNKCIFTTFIIELYSLYYYDPDTLKDHASYAFNDHCQKNPAPIHCLFGAVATLIDKDPSKKLFMKH